MKTKSYDVFISYRREGGLDFARSIAYYLRIEGLQCFFDQRELKTGQFNQQIYTAIDNSRYFLAVITPGSLERCAEENDWVRSEIEHAIEQGLTIIPVAIRGEKLSFPDNLPASMCRLKMAQASFIDRETDFEDTIVKMLRDQMTNLSSTTERQRKKAKSRAEKVFVKKARRFKNNDGVIDGDERVELERLASASGISRNRLEELIEVVEASAARRARAVAWLKGHPLVSVFALAGLALAALAASWMLVSGLRLVSKCGPSSRSWASQSADVGIETFGTAVPEPPKNIGVDDSRDRLLRVDATVRSLAERDLCNGLTRDGRRRAHFVGAGSDFAKVKWAETEHEEVMKVGRKLVGLGMQPYEVVMARPDLVLRMADIRLRFAEESKRLIVDGRHEEALVYYNAMKEMFSRLMMLPPDRPMFAQ